MAEAKDWPWSGVSSLKSGSAVNVTYGLKSLDFVRGLSHLSKTLAFVREIKYLVTSLLINSRSLLGVFYLLTIDIPYRFTVCVDNQSNSSGSEQGTLLSLIKTSYLSYGSGSEHSRRLVSSLRVSESDYSLLVDWVSIRRPLELDLSWDCSRTAGGPRGANRHRYWRTYAFFLWYSHSLCLLSR